MIPDSIILILFAASILGVCNYYGRTTTTKEGSK